MAAGPKGPFANCALSFRSALGKRSWARRRAGLRCDAHVRPQYGVKITMHVVVTYESQSKAENTKHAAHRIAKGLRSAGAEVDTFSVDNVDHGALARADVVIVGTWCGGLFFFGQHPGGAGKIAGQLPDLWDKATFSFVSYAHNPGQAAEKLGEVLEAMGAVNLGVGTIHRSNLNEDADAFVADVLAEFAST